ncbi:MAG: hypothetical protein UX94_C0004G0041 [Parcubacteria group bacterium GW2011_GWA2_47_21]|nr:MAG: hypothetical protein UX94_C0004G0041 [Parcubacteria group bacterium GW2011_GWA2_47_21]
MTPAGAGLVKSIRNAMGDKMKKFRSIEKLHHFVCQKCKRWWTVGDAPVAKKIWFCPWCGKKNNYKIMKSQI